MYYVSKNISFDRRRVGTGNRHVRSDTVLWMMSVVIGKKKIHEISEKSEPVVQTPARTLAPWHDIHACVEHVEKRFVCQAGDS